MHPAQRAGAAAGHAAAIEDRHGDLICAFGVELVHQAGASATAWIAGHQPTNGSAGQRVATYIEAYVRAYHQWLGEQHDQIPWPAAWLRPADGQSEAKQMPENDHAAG